MWRVHPAWGVVLLALALAGCGGAPAPAQSEAAADGGLASLLVVVVDPLVRPLANATVVLNPGGSQRTTGENGSAMFDGLDAGAYQVRASLPGHVEGEVAVELQPGQDLAVRLQLVAVVRPMPYHDVYHYDGFMEAYAGQASFVVEDMAPGALQCRCTWVLDPPEDGLTTFILEADGNVALENPAPAYGTIYWEFIGNPQNDFRAAHGHFPVRQEFERNSFDGATQDWTVRLTGGMWVHANQQFDVYVTTWYNTVPPEGWSFLEGDN